MARYSMTKLGHPSEADCKDMVCSNMIAHFPVTPSDIDAANNIFGREIQYQKGKKARSNTPLVVSDYVEIPRKIKEMNQSLMVSEDVMFVRGLAFLVSVLRGIKFITIEYIPKRTAPVISKSLKKLYYIYHVHVFTVELFLMDREFE